MDGVRELRRDASRWLARLRAGETLIVNDRGRLIARLAPLRPGRGTTGAAPFGWCSAQDCSLPGRDLRR